MAASDSLSIAITIENVTGIETPADFIPDHYEVYAPYPNPFNPEVTVQVDIPEPTSGTISIYDILGRQIATLYQGIITPGRYQYHWDGMQYATGMYFVRVSTNLGSQTYKILLLK